ncbi:MAG: LysM peptidoglycan-binding domain-containing protein, partial [Anaerolineae bacterium]|nr:LysM peptidoglycan-binding domain-containing protein [Anaerolineae bacterium]
DIPPVMFATDTPAGGGLVLASPTPDGDGQGGFNPTTPTLDQGAIPLGETTGLTVIDMTATGVALNQTAIAAQLSTPTPTFQVPQLGGEMTATAMILNATNQAATLTATFFPSPMPTATTTPEPSATLAPGVSQPQVIGECEHVVQRGENLYRIAQRYGVDWGVLRDSNGIVDVRRLSIGTVLTIPGCVSDAPSAPSGDTTTPGGDGVGSYTEHIVQPGENIYRIALRYGITMNALVNANGLTNINYIRAGDTLIIPTG